MNTFYYVAYIRKDGDGVDSIGCIRSTSETKDREFFHKLLDEFLDNCNNPGNEANENITCFKLCLCGEYHEGQRKIAKECL